MGWRWRGTSTTFRVSAYSSSDNCESSVNPSPTDAAHALVRAFIHTRIDYCNGLLASCPRYLTDKLQVVLRAATRLVLHLPYRSTVSEVIHRQLHWLDVVLGMNYKHRPPRLQMSPWPSSRLFIRSVHSGFNFRRPCQHTLILEVGPTTVRPTNQNKWHWVHEGSTTPCLPCGTRSRWTCVIPGLSLHSFRTKLKSHFFIVDWFFFPLIFFSVFHSCTLLLFYSFFSSPIIVYSFFSSPCTPTWCSLAGAYKCLNWIISSIGWIGSEVRMIKDLACRHTLCNRTIIQFRHLYAPANEHHGWRAWRRKKKY